MLDVACGSGFLAKKLSKEWEVTATDIIIDNRLKKNNKHISFREGNIEKLPFNDKAFDTVVCAHTLEYTQNLQIAINEVRRVAKQRLIIVVPKQRPYRLSLIPIYNFSPMSTLYLY